MPELHYLIGDATKPVKTPAIISHVCNDANGMGRGFALAISQKYSTVKSSYHQWFKDGSPQLGDVQFVRCTAEITVANMIGQHGVQWQGKVPPIRYDALRTALERVYASAKEEGVTVHMPRIGAELAGGAWPVIEGIIKDTMKVETFIYTLEIQKDRWPTEYENLGRIL